MKTMDYTAIVNVPHVLTTAIDKSVRGAVKRAFYRGTVAGRLVLRKAFIKKGSKTTTFGKESAHKRVRRRTWAKDGTPYNKMRAVLEIANWPEHLAAFATKTPKTVRRKGKRRYFQPQISPLGKKGKQTDGGGVFQPMPWGMVKGRGAKRASVKKGKPWRMILKRAGKARKPFKNSSRNDRAVRTSSIYGLTFQRDSIGKQAAYQMFKMTKDVLNHEIARRMDAHLKRGSRR